MDAKKCRVCGIGLTVENCSPSFLARGYNLCLVCERDGRREKNEQRRPIILAPENYIKQPYSLSDHEEKDLQYQARYFYAQLNIRS